MVSEMMETGRDRVRVPVTGSVTTPRSWRRGRAFAEERSGLSLQHVGHYSVDPGSRRGTSRTSWGWPRSRSGSPVRCSSTASTRRASSSCRWRRRRARSSPATTAACGCSPRAAASARPCSTSRCSARPCSCSTTPSKAGCSASGSRAHRRGAGPGGVDDQRRQAPRDPPVRDRPAAVPAIQLHDRRRRRPEHVRQGDAGRLRVDPGAVPGHPEFILSGNVDTDKKHSQINMIATRGSASWPRRWSRRNCSRA